MITHCIILVAGRNIRLDTGKPKSLLEIGRVTLLERHILNFTKNGINKFCLVTGYASEAIDAFVPFLTSKYGVEIETVKNEKFNLENGLSVWKAKEWVDRQNVDRFLLTMGDHIFHEGFVRSFINKINNEVDARLFLAVDKPGDSNRHIDIEDVTKVSIIGTDLISDISKELDVYQYFDTGLFSMNASVFSAFENCFAQKKYSISDTVTSLAREGQARVINVEGYQWNDVDNQADLANTENLNLT